MQVYRSMRFLKEMIEYVIADKRKRRFLQLVPRTCRYCELLGLCRSEENNWKCRHGCIVLNSSAKNGIQNDREKPS